MSEVENKVVYRFCPSCADVLQIVTYNVSGVPTKFWECPEGDWLEPYIEPSSSNSSENTEE